MINQHRDILHSAKLAKNNYCNFLDEKLHYIPYFYMFTSMETRGVHCEWDFGDATGRYLDALLLCSEITGFDEATTIAAKRLRSALDWMISEEDGLCYRPKGFDWVAYGANSFDQRSCILGLATWYKHYRDEETKQLCEKLINGLYNMGVEVEDYFYIPVESYTNKLDKRIFESKNFDITTCLADQCHYGGGVIIYPLMYWYYLTGSLAALELAGKLARFIVYRSRVYAEDGSFWMTGYGADSDGHFHSRMDSVAGILEYALVTGNDEMNVWCRKVYDWATTQGTRYGLFPEGLGKRIVRGLKNEYPEVSKHSEICCTTDMIEVALMLGKSVDPSYYDHAERYMNHILESQLDNVSWIDPSPDKDDTEVFTYKNVPERYRGSFTGRTTPNDLTNYGRYDNMGCCTAAGGRGLFLLWDGAVEYSCGKLEVNLWIEVDNDRIKITHDYIKGVVNFTTLKSCDLMRIRVPSWLLEKKDCIIASIIGNSTAKDCRPEFDGDYMVFNGTSSGISVKLNYPVCEIEDRQLFCGEEYKVFWNGNRVVEVLPKGTHIPLYERGD